MHRALAVLLLLFPVLFLRGEPEKPVPFPQPYNTEKGDPMPPGEALKKLRLPDGFQATLFAAEPDVQQPIGMTTDERGRLWVVENYTYSESKINFDKNLRDRIIILEDTKGTGTADKRTVFWDQGTRTTSVAVGFGGVFVLNAPNLLFIPARDDKPAGPPEVLLDGFDDFSIRHNIVNGLAWGPDGWLYGRHGITTTSFIGKPGTPKENRTPMNCGIWRYHPTRRIFEPVCWGTTNPWGHDWDEHGELFFINTVIGHLWHGIPGAHFKRMFGEDLNKYTYGLIDQHADHYHWDAGKSWTDSREGKGKHGELGGGHAHSGCMIYQGDNWPEKYRGGLYTLNFHGRRVNHDKLVQQGCGYVGKHEPDMIFSDDPWFRGVELLSGNDGGVFIADWSDTGECHENDGVHRTSGRIYKVTYGKPKPPEVADVSKLPDEKLIDLLAHKNDWYARKAQLVLQERATARKDMSATVTTLRQRFERELNEVVKLRYLWALNACTTLDDSFLRSLLADKCEHVRVWGIRLLVDHGAPSEDAVRDFLRLAQEDPSPLVRLYLTSALQHIPADRRAPLALRLAVLDGVVNDHNFPLMLWYGIESMVPAQPTKAIDLATASKVPLVRQYIARRLTTDLDQHSDTVSLLVAKLPGLPSKDALDIVTGMAEALRGVRRAKAPAGWARAQEVLATTDLPALTAKVRELGVVFGDGRALTEMRAIAQDEKQDGNARRAALRSLIESADKDTLPLLKKLVGDRIVGSVAVRGLATYDDPETATLLVAKYRGLPPETKPDALTTLTARSAWAKVLLQAIAEEKIPRADVTAAHARQIISLKDAALEKELTRVWGSVRTTPADKQKLIEQARKLLTKERLTRADQSVGRAAFNQICASCHRLYGQGQEIGPDLTGSNRDNLEYLLENVFDPSAIVPAPYRITILTLKSGRVLNGIVTEAGPKTLAVQLPTEKIVVQKDEVEESVPTEQSLMPENSLTPLKEEQVVALFAYLMARQQVPLPGEK
jgi:putative membrane-bound dehydrogenase-like protein